MYHSVYMDGRGVEFELEIKELNSYDSTLWRSKVCGNILGCVPREFSKIVSYFVKWVFRSGLRMLRSNNF